MKTNEAPMTVPYLWERRVRTDQIDLAVGRFDPQQDVRVLDTPQGMPLVRRDHTLAKTTTATKVASESSDSD